MERYLHTGLVADPVVKRHEPQEGHPECPERYDAIFAELAQSGALDQLEKIHCRPALDAELHRAHTPDYVRLVGREIADGAHVLSTGDAEIGPHSMEAARAAVGGCLNAVDAVITRRVKNAFCAVRPPGHHAESNRGMGFCLFNNAALATRHAQRVHGLQRVLIVDWDVHHGNGTQEIFYEDGSVFYFSVHQHPFYPGTGLREETGRGAGRGTTLNVPLPAGTSGATVQAAFVDQLVPSMAEFKPELVLVSAGFDAREHDPLGDFRLTDEDFAELTRVVLKIARSHAQDRLVSMLEGGYFLPGLARAARTHVQVLIDS